MLRTCRACIEHARHVPNVLGMRPFPPHLYPPIRRFIPPFALLSARWFVCGFVVRYWCACPPISHPDPSFCRHVGRSPVYCLFACAPQVYRLPLACLASRSPFTICFLCVCRWFVVHGLSSAVHCRSLVWQMVCRRCKRWRWWKAGRRGRVWEVIEMLLGKIVGGFMEACISLVSRGTGRGKEGFRG
ncbi:hypothetical protein HOY80DRAFT_970560 [Tuber brumale]|nr:hypothetical protein HOY80DRAFT_970560 [Tuber brumale]